MKYTAHGKWRGGAWRLAWAQGQENRPGRVAVENQHWASCSRVGGNTEEPCPPGFKLLTVCSVLSVSSSAKEVQVLASPLKFINEMEVMAGSIGVR